MNSAVRPEQQLWSRLPCEPGMSQNAHVSDLRLELLTEAHLPDFQKIVDDPDVLRFTRFPAPPEPGFAARWYARYQAGRRDGTGEVFAAMSPDGSFLGVALAPHIDAVASEMELGYLVVPAARGRGVASEMLRQLTSWAFTEGHALRVTLLIDVANVPSQRVAVRAGYTLEGVLRSTYFKPGAERGDVQLWSRLPSDPDPG
jgi:RimJ/RimL family protein N-acetyltransferase